MDRSANAFNDSEFTGGVDGLSELKFEQLFKECFRPLCAYCQSRFDFELELAKDTVHNAFVRLWENRQQLYSDSSLKSYLFKIVTTISLDVLKHRKVELKHQNFVRQQSTQDFSVNPESRVNFIEREIDQAIADLPEQMKKIFILHRYEGLKYSEVASKLNISTKTVETQMSRALSKLRQKLSRYLTFFLPGLFILS